MRKALAFGVEGLGFFWFFCGEERENGLRGGFVNGVFGGRGAFSLVLVGGMSDG